MSVQYGMGCGKCKGGVSFYTRGREAYCCKCNTFLGLSGKIKDLIQYKCLTKSEKSIEL